MLDQEWKKKEILFQYWNSRRGGSLFTWNEKATTNWFWTRSDEPLISHFFAARDDDFRPSRRSVEVIKLTNKLNSSWKRVFFYRNIEIISSDQSVVVVRSSGKEPRGECVSAAERTYRKLSSLSQHQTIITLSHTVKVELWRWKVHFHISLILAPHQHFLSYLHNIIRLSILYVVYFSFLRLSPICRRRLSMLSALPVSEVIQVREKRAWLILIFFLTRTRLIWYCKLNVQIETLSVDLFKLAWRWSGYQCFFVSWPYLSLILARQRRTLSRMSCHAAQHK